MKRAVKVKKKLTEKKLRPYDGLYGRQEKAARKKTRHYSVKASDWRAAFMPPDLDDIGLRQWCVEQAMLRPQSVDRQVIERAAKIYNWVKGTKS